MSNTNEAKSIDRDMATRNVVLPGHARPQGRRTKMVLASRHPDHAPAPNHALQSVDKRKRSEEGEDTGRPAKVKRHHIVHEIDALRFVADLQKFILEVVAEPDDQEALHDAMYAIADGVNVMFGGFKLVQNPPHKAKKMMKEMEMKFPCLSRPWAVFREEDEDSDDEEYETAEGESETAEDGEKDTTTLKGGEEDMEA